jgi:hypothetical protein
MHESWEGNISEEEQWAKISTDTKRSSYIVKDSCKNRKTTAAQVTAELNIHLEDPVSSKTVRRRFDKSNIHSYIATAKPLITENNE